MEVTFCQHDYKCNVKEHHFVYFYEVIINFYPNFMTCFFSLALFRSNTTTVNLQIYISKERKARKASSKKFIQIITEKRHDFRVHLVFKIIIRICKEILEFYGKPSKFLTKSCLFIFCFLFNWIRINPSIRSEEIYRCIYIFTLPHKKQTKKKTKGAKI